MSENFTQPLEGFSDDDERSDFEKRISIMEPVYTEDGIPLVFKRILTFGYGEQVKPDSTVLYHYTAYAEDQDEPFDSSELRNKPYLTRLANSIVIPGLFHAIISMKVGERSEFILEPCVAFGELGVPPRIPPKSRIRAIVSVRKIYIEGTIEKYLTLTLQEQANMPFHEFINIMESEKEAGNCYFKLEKFPQALVKYEAAIKCLQNRVADKPVHSDEEGEQMIELLVKLCTNAANASLKCERHKSSIVFCKIALKLKPNNFKALYHMADANFQMGKMKEAKEILQKINIIHPGNQDVLKLLSRIAKEEKDEYLESKILSKKMARAFNF